MLIRTSRCCCTQNATVDNFCVHFSLSRTWHFCIYILLQTCTYLPCMYVHMWQEVFLFQHRLRSSTSHLIWHFLSVGMVEISIFSYLKRLIKITVFSSTGWCGFFALKLILPLKTSLSTSSCTEFILTALTSLRSIFALSPFVPRCLASLYIHFWLLSCFPPVLQITLIEREHSLSCSIHPFQQQTGSILTWAQSDAGQASLRPDLSIFSMFLSLCCISSFFSYPLCRWI